MDKLSLRREMKEKLSLIDKTNFNHMSLRLSTNLIQLLSNLGVIQEKKWIGAFAPIEKEPFWYLRLSEKELKQLAYPAYAVADKDDDNKMIFKMTRMSDLVIRKDFGVEILGPSDLAIKVTPDVVLVPSLAMSEDGSRLGRGKGFYDRYLSDYRGVKIGICFSMQLQTEVPTEEHDVKLDFIVTEEKIINCKTLPF